MSEANSLPRLSEARIHHYFNMAHNACYYSDNSRIRLGAVLVYKNKVLSVGWNSTKTNPTQKRLNVQRGFDVNASNAFNTLHAEVDCLLKAKDLDIDWGKASIFVYRIKKNGEVGLSRPCKGCMTLIKSMGIKNIYYSTDDGFGYERVNI